MLIENIAEFDRMIFENKDCDFLGIKKIKCKKMSKFFEISR